MDNGQHNLESRMRTSPRRPISTALVKAGKEVPKKTDDDEQHDDDSLCCWKPLSVMQSSEASSSSWKLMHECNDWRVHFIVKLARQLVFASTLHTKLPPKQQESSRLISSSSSSSSDNGDMMMMTTMMKNGSAVGALLDQQQQELITFIPHVARILEQYLFQTACSFEEYTNEHTLMARVLNVQTSKLQVSTLNTDNIGHNVALQMALQLFVQDYKNKYEDHVTSTTNYQRPPAQTPSSSQHVSSSSSSSSRAYLLRKTKQQPQKEPPARKKQPPRKVKRPQKKSPTLPLSASRQQHRRLATTAVAAAIPFSVQLLPPPPPPSPVIQVCSYVGIQKTKDQLDDETRKSMTRKMFDMLADSVPSSGVGGADPQWYNNERMRLAAKYEAESYAAAETVSDYYTALEKHIQQARRIQRQQSWSSMTHSDLDYARSLPEVRRQLLDKIIHLIGGSSLAHPTSGPGQHVLKRALVIEQHLYESATSHEVYSAPATLNDRINNILAKHAQQVF